MIDDFITCRSPFCLLVKNNLTLTVHHVTVQYVIVRRKRVKQLICCFVMRVNTNQSIQSLPVLDLTQPLPFFQKLRIGSSNPGIVVLGLLLLHECLEHDLDHILVDQLVT